MLRKALGRTTSWPGVLVQTTPSLFRNDGRGFLNLSQWCGDPTVNTATPPPRWSLLVVLVLPPTLPTERGCTQNWQKAQKKPPIIRINFVITKNTRSARRERCVRRGGVSRDRIKGWILLELAKKLGGSEGEGRGWRGKESWRKRPANRQRLTCCERPDQCLQVPRNVSGFLHKIQANRTVENIAEEDIFVPACCGTTRRTLHTEGFAIENKTISRRFGEASLEREGVKRSRE